MFAVIKTGGKQYRVAPDDVITIGKLGGEPGETVEFAEVLMLGGDNVQVGVPTVAGAAVAGEVVEHGRGPKIIAFKKRRRKNSRRKRGYRDEFTVVRITEILTEGKRPTPRPKQEAAPRPAKAPAAEAGAADTDGAETSRRRSGPPARRQPSRRRRKSPALPRKSPAARRKSRRQPRVQPKAKRSEVIPSPESCTHSDEG